MNHEPTTKSMENKNIHEELQDISPLLTQMKGEKECYKVPHLYFENLQDKVLTKVAEQPQNTSVFARLFKSTEVATLDNISTEALALYVDENIDDLDLEVLLENDTPDLDFSDDIDIDQKVLEYYIENDL